MVQHLSHLTLRDSLTIDQGMLLCLLGINFKLDETIVKHNKLSMFRLNTNSSKDNLRFWVISSTTNFDRD